MESEVDRSKEAAKQMSEVNKDNITGKGKVDVNPNIQETEPEKTDNEQQVGNQFELKGIKINSEIKIKQKHVQHLIDPYINKKVGILELRKLAAEIKDFCRHQGYLAAVAYLPEQDSTDGVVQINIISAKFGQVKINNESSLADDILKEVGKIISTKKDVTNERIEDVLYRINEIGGVKARGELVPNIHTQGIDLHINVVNDQKNYGIFYVENYGNKSSGRYRSGLIYDMYNLDKRGSKLEVSGLISSGDLDNYAIDYSFIVDRRSTSRMGFSFGKTSYYLSKEFANLRAGGDSTDFKVYGITPIYKTIHNGCDLRYGYKYRKVDKYYGYVKDFENFLGISLGGEPKENIHDFSLELVGYKRSLSNSLFNYSAGIYFGNVSSRNESAVVKNMAAQTASQFTRSEVKLDYRQLLTPHFEFHTNFKLQNASNNLHDSEKLQLGGASGVRGYGDGDASGDEGYLSTTEFIWHTKVPGLTFSTFFDIGGCGNKLNHDIQTIRSWGTGLGYSKPNDYFFKFEYARKIGNNENVTNDFTRNRLWFMAGKIF